MSNSAKYRKKLEQFIEDGQELKILTLISRLHPDDIADLIEALDEEKKSKLFRLLDVETASDVILSIDDISRELILDDLTPEKLISIVEDMPTDDAADLIGELPKEQARDVLHRMNQEKAAEVQMLLEYPEDSAGGIMQAELISINENKTVQDAIEYIREKYEEVGEIHNVFVTNDASQLVGVVPLKKLILAKGGTLMKDIEDRCITFATPEMDQEEVSQLFKKYDVVTLPVVNRQMQILGRIVVDDVIDVIEQEVSEDIFRMSGMSEEEDIVYSATPIKICMTRLPWLMFNFFGTLVSGYFLWLYQSRLQDLLALLAFVPVICAMSGNIGVQSTSIVIRGLATGRVDLSNLGRTIGKECIVGCIIGIVCGVIGGLVGMIWHSRFVLGLIVFLSMFIAIFFGAFMGVVVPLLFKKIKIDPAVASGALITTANDLVAINVYFLLAAVLTKAFIS